MCAFIDSKNLSIASYSISYGLTAPTYAKERRGEDKESSTWHLATRTTGTTSPSYPATFDSPLFPRDTYY
uniref:Uncharacterized protein n=1 Tax=Kalanchoe fedtschenkoi TaxID=63787 RepID=A0A7N0UKJ9_KALFE